MKREVPTDYGVAAGALAQAKWALVTLAQYDLAAEVQSVERRLVDVCDTSGSVVGRMQAEGKAVVQPNNNADGGGKEGEG